MLEISPYLTWSCSLGELPSRVDYKYTYHGCFHLQEQTCRCRYSALDIDFFLFVLASSNVRWSMWPRSEFNAWSESRRSSTNLDEPQSHDNG